MKPNSPNDGLAADGATVTKLVTAPNLGEDTDDVYNEIVDTQKQLTEAQGAIFQASLVLVLANHIGDAEVIRSAIEICRQNAIAEVRRQRSNCGGVEH